jgi:hypothetical protein
MSRITWMAAGLIVATALAVVVNLVTSSGAWWLWLSLAGLVVVAVVIEAMRERRPQSRGESSQEISATGKGQVPQSGSPPSAPPEPEDAATSRVVQPGSVQQIGTSGITIAHTGVGDIEVTSPQPGDP